ncbi:MAG: ribonuclease HII [Prochlorococcus sp. SP3034]|nr:ribonuclease HII [Prochlorococcus sp. SP3034]|tara:strand:- start:3737 stop:4366 length:630 start_codon:yes stop_codon:yes gene_type:complete
MILTFLEEKEEDLLQQVNKEFEIGLDEVGRGCIFGPIFAAAVVLSQRNCQRLKKLGLDDSKKLTPKKRESLLPEIIKFSNDYGIGQSSVREIDKYGIRFANELAMMRAIYKLKKLPTNILIDGFLPLRVWKGNQANHIKGESKFASIAAASIIAKVNRDSLMARLEKKYQGYLLYRNKGYGTKQHFLGIKNYGLTPLHRKSFLKKLDII